jgi:hypothetical protein
VREETDGNVTVAFMDPEAVLQLVDNPQVKAFAKEVKALLVKVSERLSK